MGIFGDLRLALGARVKRQRLLLRAFRSRHQLTAVSNRTVQIDDNDLLLFATVRNEIARLPYFLIHSRAWRLAFSDRG